MQAAILAMAAAASIAMTSAAFGVGLARLIWADDLRHAQQIDAIRSKTEQHLRGQIEAMQNTIDTLKRSQ